MLFVQKQYNSDIVFVHSELFKNILKQNHLFKITNNEKYDLILYKKNISKEIDFLNLNLLNSCYISKKGIIIQIQNSENNTSNIIILNKNCSAEIYFEFGRIYHFLLIDDLMICSCGKNKIYFIFKNDIDNEYKIIAMMIPEIEYKKGEIIELNDEKIGILDDYGKIIIFEINYDLIKNTKEKEIILKDFYSIKHEYKYEINQVLFITYNNLFCIKKNNIIINNFIKNTIKEIKIEREINTILNLNNKNIMVIYNFDKKEFKFDFEIISIIDKEYFIQKTCDIFFYFK